MSASPDIILFVHGLWMTRCSWRTGPPTTRVVARHGSEKYEKSKATTAYREYPGRPHFPGAPGSTEVADYALDWAGKNARTT
jgi:hypothetical protein